MANFKAITSSASLVDIQYNPEDPGYKSAPNVPALSLTVEGSYMGTPSQTISASPGGILLTSSIFKKAKMTHVDVSNLYISLSKFLGPPAISPY